LICSICRLIPFAIAILEISCDVAREHLSTFAVGIGSTFFHAGWNALFLSVFINVVNTLNNSTQSDTFDKVIIFLLALSYYWTSQVISNVNLVSVAGVVAEWYFKAPQMGPSPMMRSLKRALTTSFGTICFGSFLVGLIRALRYMLRQRQGGGGIGALIACIVGCLLACLESFIRMINFWAFTYVAIYGMPYCNAIKSTFDLFDNRGFHLIISEDIIAGCLTCICFLGGLICVGIALLAIKAAGWFNYVNNSTASLVSIVYTILIIEVCILAFILGVVFCAGALNVIQSAVGAIYVSYAEDPAALLNTKPEYYNKLTNAYLSVYRGKVPMFN